ncbi:hypothetical protein SMICM17S_02022 [Streptomyces microflavus]
MSVLEHVDRILLTAAIVLVLVAGLLLLVRIWLGPSMLDRAISLDVIAALIIAGLGAKSAFARDPFYFPIMLVLAFLGFLGVPAHRRAPRPLPYQGRGQSPCCPPTTGCSAWSSCCSAHPGPSGPGTPRSRWSTRSSWRRSSPSGSGS